MPCSPLLPTPCRPLLAALFAALLACMGPCAHHARAALPTPVVPAQMRFCGMDLTLTPAAQAKLEKEVAAITAHPQFYLRMAEKAAVMLPIMQQGFRDMGAPTDLVYISIQESGLRGEAVSKSNAVGYWQFKDFTAREVGLRVDRSVDERKHLYRSSVGAARYFFANYLRHRNWVYAVISYMTGGTGALPFIDDAYIGQRTMTIDDDLHWYAMRALAHKLAYEGAVASAQPGWRLQAFSNGQVTQAAQLAKRHELPLDSFRALNPWIPGHGSLPADRPFSYYVPGKGNPDPLNHMEPHRELFDPPAKLSVADAYWLHDATPALLAGTYRATTPPNPKPPKPRATPPAPGTPPHTAPTVDGNPPLNIPKEPAPDLAGAQAKPSTLAIQDDPYYNKDYTLPQTLETLGELAVRTGVSLRRLKRWNKLDPEGPLPADLLVRLVKPKRQRYHVAGPNETIYDVAMAYKLDVHRLANLNRIRNPNVLLHPGQRVYLKRKKPYREGLLLYDIRPGAEDPTP